jgi:hypothetical protein
MNQQNLVQRARQLLARQPEQATQRESVKAGEMPKQSAPIPPTLQAGDRITWQREGSPQNGEVDFLHVDETGQQWAFVTQGSSWSVVNLKFAKRSSV